MTGYLDKLAAFLNREAVDAEFPEQDAQAYAEERMTAGINNCRLAAIAGLIFVPLGAVLDFVSHGDTAEQLQCLAIRFCAFLLLVPPLLMILSSHWQRHYRKIGVYTAIVPIYAILVMMYFVPGGPTSPYYAGVNLTLLGAAYILRSSFRDTLSIVGLTWIGFVVLIMLYGGLEGKATVGGQWIPMLVNNGFFLFCTGIFVLLGTLVYGQQRWKEFSLRQKTEHQREELARINEKEKTLRVETERQREQLAKQNVEEQKLREETEHQREELARSHEKLQALDEAKTAFFANISHELRTPLTLLLGPLDRLKTLGEWDRDEAHRLLGTMENNGLRLLRLINDLLDLVKLDTGTMEPVLAPVPLNAFLDGLAASVAFACDESKIMFKADINVSETFLLDRGMLEKVILNLLINAIKFTPHGGEVLLRSDYDGDGILTLEVKDSGIGIPKEQQEQVFNRFWQADGSARRKHQGTGIGLALVKSLMDAMGGTIEIWSKPEAGTVFTITLPVEEASVSAGVELSEEEETVISDLHKRARVAIGSKHEAPEAGMSAAHSLHHQTHLPGIGSPDGDAVLVADDEPAMLEFVCEELKGLTVLKAVDGEMALQLALQRTPGAVILDYMMPELTGIEVCKKLRADRRTRNVPVVILTARADEQSKMQALDAGANDFLAKPFSSMELRARVENLLAMSKAERDLSRRTRELQAALDDLEDSREQLLQSEKLASLGRMSAGIIHEINNPMNYVKTGVHMIETFGKYIPDDERKDYKDTVNDVREGLERVIGIITDLKTFTRQSVQAYSAVNLKKMIDSSCRLMRHKLEETGVDMSAVIDDSHHVKGNESQLSQVFVNLISNAGDALALKKMELGEDFEPRIRIWVEEEGERLAIIVHDNGSGICKENMDKIFDPFYTSKQVGAGMGLGLAISYSIIDQHTGSMTAESEVDKYTKIKVCLPVSDPNNPHTTPQEHNVITT